MVFDDVMLVIEHKTIFQRIEIDQPRQGQKQAYQEGAADIGCICENR
jgi:hypothetical protein